MALGVPWSHTPESLLAVRNPRTGRGRIAIILVSSLAIRPTAPAGRESRADIPERSHSVLAPRVRSHVEDLLRSAAGDWLRSAGWACSVPSLGERRRRGPRAEAIPGDPLTLTLPHQGGGDQTPDRRRRGLASVGAGDWLRSAPKLAMGIRVPLDRTTGVIIEGRTLVLASLCPDPREPSAVSRASSCRQLVLAPLLRIRLRPTVSRRHPSRAPAARLPDYTLTPTRPSPTTSRR